MMEQLMFNKLNLSAEIIVVGTGPGGATVARELSKYGKKVLLLERGYDHRQKIYYGTYLGAIRYSDRASLLFTEEGLNIIAPIMVGGATSMYAGCAAEPPRWLKHKYGIQTDDVVLGKPGWGGYAQHPDGSLAIVSAGGNTQWHRPGPALAAVEQDAGNDDQT
jgi:choline dehydrogenase-like flavoprotein